MIIDTTNRPELVAQSSKSLLRRDIEAMILGAEYHRVLELPPILPMIPVAVLDGYPDDAQAADSVVPDEAGGAHTAVSRLVAAGHRRIGFRTVGGDRYIASPRVCGLKATRQPWQSAASMRTRTWCSPSPVPAHCTRSSPCGNGTRTRTARPCTLCVANTSLTPSTSKRGSK
jgi:hypothetical protein